MNLKKRCNYKGCRALLDSTESYCKRHRGSNNREYSRIRRDTDREYIDFYSQTRWRELRYQKLLDESFLCEECMKEDKLTEANTVHHLIEVKDDWSKRFDWDNLQAVCFHCHNRLHRR